MATITVRFVLLVAGEDVFIEEYIERPEVLLDYYLSLPDLSCCRMQGGLKIAVDGEEWEEGYDEFWMLASWLRVVRALLEGEQTILGNVWEESRLRIERDGDRITLTDVAIPPLTTSASAFIKEVVRAITQYARLENDLQTEILARAGSVDAAKLALIRENVLVYNLQEELTQIEALMRKEYFSI